MNSTWSVDWLMVAATANTEVVRTVIGLSGHQKARTDFIATVLSATGSYLALAGVISLLLCLLLLASVNMCTTCRNPDRQVPTCLNSTPEFKRESSPCSPYHMTHLHQGRDSSAKSGRKSSGSDGYAKPYRPGPGVSLSEHYVYVDMELNDVPSPVLATGACHQGSAWYDTDNFVFGDR